MHAPEDHFRPSYISFLPSFDIALTFFSPFLRYPVDIRLSFAKH